MKNSYPLRSLSPILLFVLLSACGSNGKEESLANTGTSSSMDTALVFILKSDTLRKTVELPGELLPYEQTDLYAKVSGFVKTMNVDMGDRVRKGQRLAVIEAPEMNTRIAEAESSLQAAKAKWVSSKDNYDRLYRASQSPSPGIVAPVDLVNAENRMQADSASYEALRQQVRAYQEVSGYLYITAPFDGVITSRKVNPGALVGTGSMLLTLQNNQTLRLRVAVPEIYVATASRSPKISFNVDAYPEQSFIGTLTRKTETVDPSTRTELWEFEVNNANYLLKAGVFVNAKIPMERKGQSFIISPSALATTQERKFVTKVTGGVTAWVDVRQGINTDKGVEVFGPLQNGDTLLVRSTDEKKPGTKNFWKLR